MIHEFFEPFTKFFLDLIHFDLVIEVQLFLFNVELIALDNEFFQGIENVLFDQP